MVSILPMSKLISTQKWEAKKLSHKFLLPGSKDEIQGLLDLKKIFCLSLKKLTYK